MHRVTTVVYCAFVLAALAYVVAHGRWTHSLALDAAHTSAPTSSPAVPGTAATTEAEVGHQADASAPRVELTEVERVLAGGPVPPLPPGAPRSVTLGIILVTHAEAQFAPKQARDKRSALKLARQLVAEAKENFKEAATKGDPGSAENAGRMPRNVLDPALQYVIYTMEKGSVFDEPLDTPRGYWIVKRHQ